jgi:nitroreductase
VSGATPAVGAEALLAMMRRRRVTREFTGDPVPDEVLRQIVEASRWATSGGNRYPHRFLVVRDRARVRLVRSASPGMIPVPPALIVILIDTEQARSDSMKVEVEPIHWVDVGTAAMNMMAMAQALGVGSCPVTSFSKSGVATMLDLPPHLVPEFILILGYPAPTKRVVNSNAPKPVTARDLTFWERVGERDPTEAT